MGDCWNIHDTAVRLRLSESRVRQCIREHRLDAMKVKGKYGPEWRVHLDPLRLPAFTDAEQLARTVLEQAEQIRQLKRGIDRVDEIRGCG